MIDPGQSIRSCRIKHQRKTDSPPQIAATGIDCHDIFLCDIRSEIAVAWADRLRRHVLWQQACESQKTELKKVVSIETKTCKIPPKTLF